jgi:acyl-CoA thioesterase I
MDMRCYTLFFAILIMFVGCRKQSSPAAEDGRSGASYLALGDSYTIGESVTEPERWPVILADTLAKTGTPVKTPRIIATTGWTTRDLLAALQNFNPETPFDVVSLMIGVNNQYQGRSIDEFRFELIQLLDKSIGYAGGDTQNVFVLSIPDWGMTPLGAARREQIGKEIDQFNAVVKAECDKKNIRFIDITVLTRTVLTDPSLLAKDRLHYSGSMHRLWANEVLSRATFNLRPSLHQ